uniref:CCHC-type domain-containing protein n=1 Tax=Lepisosteus oculatus TaxID=7918 RepID=W5NLC4_LEPOC
AERCKNTVPLTVFHVEPLFARESRTLYVRMFNPFVPEAEIRFFLKRYVDVRGPGQKVLDAGRYWTCKRRYQVRLRPCATAVGGVVHPPSPFSIGASQGYLYYYGQPKICRKCGKEDHIAEDCENLRCRRCGVDGHMAKDCKENISCNLCGDPMHVYSQCPGRVRTYAEVIG